MSRLRRPRDDRGAVLVEFALMLPLLAVLVLGILDYGFLFRQSTQVQQSVQNAARTAAGAGNWRFADYEALRAIDSGVAGTDRVDVERVIVWDAQDASGDVPGDCLAVAAPAGSTNPKGIAGVCNVYSDAQVASDGLIGYPANPNVDTCDTSHWDWHWCPTDRNPYTVQTDSADFLGVYVEGSYEPLTGILGVGDFTFERTAVYRLEPCVEGVSRGDCDTSS